MLTRQRLIAVAIVFAGALLPGGAAAQSYGGGDQVLTIAAPSFRGFIMPGAIDPADGYLHATSDNYTEFGAPVRLPDGAQITQVCLYARDEDPSVTVSTVMVAIKLAPGGEAPGVVSVPGSVVVADFHFGYGVVCTGPMSYTVHDTADVDHDGTPEHVALRVYALLNAASPVVGFGGVRIAWHRQISPKPATASFTDVPTDHEFFQFVEALVAAGITAGYGDGRYGVDDPITRGQMAVFLSSALGLHWTN